MWRSGTAWRNCFDPDFESRQAEPAAERQPAEAAGQEEVAAGPRKAVEPQEKEVTTATSKITPRAAGNKLPPLNFARLRELVSITQVLEHVNWQPRKRRGEPWRGGCPVHEETDAKSEAFAIETQKNLYCCHRCGSQGNALDLWMALSGKPILSASWDLVETFELDPPLLGE